MELEGKKASRIRTTLEMDLENRDNWEKCFQWLMTTGQDFQNVFSLIIKKLRVDK